MKDKGEEVHAVRERDILKLLYKNREKETKSNRNNEKINRILKRRR